MSALRGQVVLVTFWSTTCTPCLRKMPELMAMHRRLAPQGLATFAVAMSYDRPDWVLNYAQRQQPPFTIALDVQGHVARAFEDTQATPTLFLVDRDGNILRRWVGEPDVAVIEKRVRAALG
jgi:peroxiredoxin